MAIRVRPSAIGRFSAARKTLGVLALCATVLVPMELLGTTTASAAGPSTTVYLPSNGSTVSGDTWVDASAQSPAGVASVHFEVSGGSISDMIVASTFPTIYGWLGGWDTTDVPNGTYTIESVVTDDAGNSAPSTAISITVDNPPPTTTVVLGGGLLDSAQTNVLDAVASPGVTQVSIVVTVAGETIPLTATPTIYGWIVVLPANQPCNPQTTPDCRTESASASIQSVASYSGGVTGTSPPVPATIIIYQLVG
jgi:hypothetical protein